MNVELSTTIDLPGRPGIDHLTDDDGVPYVAVAQKIVRRPRQIDKYTAPPGQARRRGEPRYRASESQVWIQWWADGEFNGLSARLVNVSRHGAMIVAAVLLREHQAMRIFLEEPAPQIGVDSVVLGVDPGKHGLHLIRLTFRSECPDGFFTIAAEGFEAWLARDRSYG